MTDTESEHLVLDGDEDHDEMAKIRGFVLYMQMRSNALSWLAYKPNLLTNAFEFVISS